MGFSLRLTYRVVHYLRQPCVTCIYCCQQKENIAVFSGGQLRGAADKDATNRRRKWAVPGSAQGGAIYIEDKSVSASYIHRHYHNGLVSTYK